MPFNTLLLTCLIHGTRFGEQGATVSIKPKSGETILFFSVDDQSNEGCGLRKMGMQGALCDLVIFFDNAGEKKTLCMVELKGSDLKRAIEQVINTRDFLKNNLPTGLRQHVVWKACILLTGKSPQEVKQLEKHLEEAFGKENFRIPVGGSKGKESKILEMLLRGQQASSQKQRKGK